MTEPITDARAAAATDRLFALLPAHVRDRDAREGHALRALFQVLGRASAEIDAELDRLLDALFVETAPASALPAFAALVGAPGLAPLPSGEVPRAFIANLLRFRRGKGTTRVLAELALALTGEGAVAVEYFQRLARLANLIDPRPDRPALADLRPGDMASRAGRAADGAARLADLRSIARAAGRWHVPMVGVHLLRPLAPLFPAPRAAQLTPATMAGVPAMRPWPAGGGAHPGYWQLAAQPGRRLRLFNPDRQAEAEAAGKGGRPDPWHLPDRLRRLPLHLETEALRHGTPPAAGWFTAEGLPFALFARRADEADFTRLAPETLKICNLEDDPPGPGDRPAATIGGAPVSLGFDPATGRAIAPKPGAGQKEIVELRIAFATGIGRPIGAGPQERNDDSVPFEIRDTAEIRNFVRIVDATQAGGGAASDPVRTVPSLADALADLASDGAGKRAFVLFVRAERETAAVTLALHPGTTLHLVAAQWRPRKTVPGLPEDPDRLGYIVRRERRFTLDNTVTVAAAAPPGPGEGPGELVLDGLELTRGLVVGAQAASSLWLRHVTLRNPGTAALAAADARGLRLRIDDSLCGPLVLKGDSAGGRVEVAGSILSPDDSALHVLDARDLEARLCDCTLLGAARVGSVEATGCLFAGVLKVARRQAGCLRHSWLAPGSTGPRRFRCQPDLALAAAAAGKGAPLTKAEATAVAIAAQPLFLDTSLDEPTCALLHPLCPEGIRAGGEGGTEMGVFGPWAASLRRANLASLFDDFIPFGLEAAILDDAQSAPQALRRNRP